MQRDTRWVLFPFLGLVLFWGSSYFWIKVGIASLPPLTLIAGRLLVGAVLLSTVVVVAREPLPRERRMYGHLLVMSVINIALPFALITFGERSVDSALASILNATVPLSVIVLAPLFLPDEHITRWRILGLAIGFAGVMVLVAPDLVNLSHPDLAGDLMLLASSVSYGAGNVYAKRNVHGLRPMIPALFQVLFAAAIMGVLALVIDQPIGHVAPPPEAIVAVVWLGLLGSGMAYLCYFTILQNWGATRTSMVAYLLPVVGIALGTLRGEPVTAVRVGGMALIIAGVALVNSGPAIRRLLDRRTDALDATGARGG
jgi:drug/metabolite transporter (DMT)-like permease